MNRSPIVFLLLAATAAAQNVLDMPATAVPGTFELANFNIRPFMQTNCRVQMFFDATQAGSSAFTATALLLRYDGPIPQVGAPGPFTIQRLRIAVGSTAVAIPGAGFAQNLTQPLTNVLDAPWSYLPDPGSASPHPFGAPSNSLRFPFSTPVGIAIPPGGWFVVDLQMEGNNIANFGFSHAILDGLQTSGGVSNGTAVSYGQGCSAAVGAPAATIGSTGTYAPGAAYFVNGQHLGPNALVLSMLGFSDTISGLGPLPLQLPTTNCTLLQSLDLYNVLISDAAGSIPANTPAAAIVVPPVPAFAGVPLYHQLVSLVAGANPLDLVLSDARTITLGGLLPPSMGIYAVSHGNDANATIADIVEPFGYALRLEVF